MKRVLVLFLILIFMTSCGEADSFEVERKITVGIPISTMSAKVYEAAKPFLIAKGFEVSEVRLKNTDELKEALISDTVDAIFGITLKDLEEEFIAVGGGIFIQTFGLFSSPLNGVYANKISDIPNEAAVLIPNDPAQRSFSLELLREAGLITLSGKKNFYDLEDVSENDKNLSLEVVDERKIVDSFLNRTCYAVMDLSSLQLRGLDIMQSMFNYHSDEAMVSLITRSGNENSENVGELYVTLTAEGVKKFLHENYPYSLIMN